MKRPRRLGRSLAVLDNSCLDLLRSHESRREFRGNLRAANWTTYATELNLLEAYMASGNLRSRLVETVRWVGEGRPLLPRPQQLLKAIAEAIAAGEPSARATSSALEWALSPEPAQGGAVDELASRARDILSKEEAHFRGTHEAAWEAMKEPRRHLLSAEQRGMPAAQFLDEVWLDPPHANEYVAVAWSELGMAGDAPVERLLENECWQLYLEAWGIGAYRLGFRANRAKPVGWVDVMQLIYLGTAPRRMFLVFEGPLREAATDVLAGRHIGAVAADPSDLCR